MLDREHDRAVLPHLLVVLTSATYLLGVGVEVGTLAALGTVMLYFLWKSQSAFVIDHAKQAAGFQALVIAMQIVQRFWAMTRRQDSSGTVLLVSLLLGGVGLVFGMIGVSRAQRGAICRYPGIGKLIARIDI